MPELTHPLGAESVPTGDDVLLGAVVAGRYHVKSRLAAGGMGVVYEATQEPLGRKIALKVIRGDTQDPVARMRFEREAKAASTLSDPHVVVVHDFGVIDDGPAKGGLYLAMEYVEGETLRDLLRRRDRLPWGEAAVIVRQVAKALAAAHAQGVVHRDLKPENIMVLRRRSEHDGDELHCKVLDFGLAKGTGAQALLTSGDGPLTRSGGFVGTPGYISPEAVNGAAEDPRQDVYALGIMWWELLSGVHPYTAETPMKTLVRQMHEDPPLVGEVQKLAPAMPLRGAELLIHMMARLPEGRPRDGAAVLGRLESAGSLGSGRVTSVDVDNAVDSNADTVTGAREQVAPPPSSPPSSSPSSSFATRDERPTRTAPTPSSPTSAPAANASSGSRRRVPVRYRLFGAFVAASVIGTIGGVVAMRTVERRRPRPIPPIEIVADAGVQRTELDVSGLTSFRALARLRALLPTHELSIYKDGHATLSFKGDVGTAVADALEGATFVVDEQTWAVEVSEFAEGHIAIAVTPETVEDVVDLEDAGVNVAPGGLEP